MTEILLNKAHLDWLTLTSWNKGAIEVMSALFNGARGKPARRMQYEGTMYQNDAGSVFFGTDEQRNKAHYLCQVSGLRANEAWEAYGSLAANGLVKVTRVDGAITTQVRHWSQSHLFSRLRKIAPFRSGSYLESKSGPQGRKLATVYVGSRSVYRMLRIYEKVLPDDAIALRFEVEYKAGRAAEVARLMLAGSLLDNFLKAEVELLDDNQLSRLFLPLLDGTGQLPVVRREKNRTQEWLMQQVLPALQRFLNEHGNEAHELRYAFLKILLNAGLDETDEGPVQ